MSSTTPQRTRPPRRSFGMDTSAIEEDNNAGSQSPQIQPGARRPSGRLSFGQQQQRRPSFVNRWRSGGVDEESQAGGETPVQERAPIPSALQPSGEVYATPLPIISMIVLSITMLGEFLTANVSAPFLLFMVRGFGELEDEAQVAFWTGIIVAAFFLTQFITSLLWATVAEKHGRRAVLCVSLLGSAITCSAFGTATTIKQAMVIRLLQGVFAGSVGVARGSVTFVTDASNEGRAYAILGFCWGFGGVAGAIIGGSFEKPAKKWPGIFSNIPLFVDYPYLLPCLIAASITLTGSILSCFLNYDGGPREGAIYLQPEKDDDQTPVPGEETNPPTPIFEDASPAPGVVGSLKKKVSQRFSGLFASRVPDARGRSGSNPALSFPSTAEPAVPLQRNSRAMSRTSKVNGSAYGYAGSYRNRLASNSSAAFGGRRPSASGSSRPRRGSNYDRQHELSASEATNTSDLTFAQRLLMANENAVTNIADLWVAAAMNVDNEDPFESDDEMGSDEDADILGLTDEEQGADSSRGRRTSTATARRPSRLSMPQRASGAFRPPTVYGSPRRPSIPNHIQIPARQTSASFSQPWEGTPTNRRFSTNVPSIFAHPGVKTPVAVLEAQQLLAAEPSPALGSAVDPLQPIMESRRTSAFHPAPEVEQIDEKQPSLLSAVPMIVVVQYGLLALYTTTHDQVFMSYLVSDFEAGGLNLNAGHFAQLIALMCLAQIAYQFYLYPNIGPPRGRFSHLAMFRLGSLLFIPSYLTVTLYRPFASAEEDGNLLVMTALAVSTAVRFCGNTFSYTAISILLNYMTPPHAVGYANGIAQSIVSLARCVGPVLGGWLWSISVEGNPSGYPFGFFVCAGACAVAIAHSFFIR